MVYRHSIVTRITHAVFSCAFLALAASGLQIFRHQRLFNMMTGPIHRYTGIVMIACGLAYAVNAWQSGELRKLLYGPDDSCGIVPMLAYYLRLRAKPPSHADYNPLQKLAYSVLLFGIAPLLAITGILMWTKTGGRGVGVWHLGFAIEITAFFFGHLFMVATTGLRNNLRSMITGWHRQKQDLQTLEGGRKWAA